ncbi:hypothetical protein [Fodinibius salsisoli]|uniref:PH domain-containing protein n=1 Tax=Fodinibius salsisoli TaxID=2820877 RepID=A0ABT3PR15_9BACT|nr:hypothetical protein [Fodinibius salsisoli]MCW9708303.1 hypothetical protein [Fodinibius salsisoli]
MSTSITIQEHRHHIWKTGTYVSVFLAVLLGIIFWNATDPLWIGIFRLAAFIFFSLSIFGLLKSMGTPLTITLSSSSDHLLVNYHQGDDVVQKEQFECSSIDDFTVSTDTPVNWFPFLYPPSATIKVAFNDGHKDLNLFEYSGRTLFFEKPKLQEVLTFLRSQNIPVQPVKTS